MQQPDAVHYVFSVECLFLIFLVSFGVPVLFPILVLSIFPAMNRICVLIEIVPKNIEN